MSGIGSRDEGTQSGRVAQGSVIPGGGDPFPRVGRDLLCGAVSLESIAREFGTPTYVYNMDHILSRFRRVQDAFSGVDTLVAYSVKANGNLAILDRLARAGAGADIVSEGELFRALRGGIPSERVVFAGVGKTEPEMEAALREGIYALSVESAGELRTLSRVASRIGIPAPVALRVNPDILSPTPHEYTRTGHAASKFGIPVPEALELYRWASERPEFRVRGIAVHIGSQIVDPDPFIRAMKEVLDIADRLASEGIPLEFVDLGGGYGVGYDRQEPELLLEELAARVVPELAERGLRLVLEPGRFVVGEAGVLLTRVLYVKESGGKVFAITDGGMTELLRPSHYGGYHRIEPVVNPAGAPTAPVDVVGPICETGDFLARDREMPVPEPGDLLAVRTAGAYGFVMALNYNGRRRPAEVMVEGPRVELVRERETLEDLIRHERIPPSADVR